MSNFKLLLSQNFFTAQLSDIWMDSNRSALLFWMRALKERMQERGLFADVRCVSLPAVVFAVK
jgi:hypothetical protein